jgi:hypothetical protein
MKYYIPFNSPIKRTRLTIYCLKKIHLTGKNKQARSERIKTFQANGAKRQMVVAILISDRADFKQN